MCHPSVHVFGARAIQREHVAGLCVLDVGSSDVNGSLRRSIESMGPASYLGIDLRPGPRVDMVRDACAPGLCASVGGPFDFVLCTEMLEHAQDWRAAVANLKACVRPGGHVLITTRSLGFPRHGFPGDHWRYELDDMRAIFSDFDLLMLESDPWAPGVFLYARATGACQADLSRVALHRAPTEETRGSWPRWTRAPGRPGAPQRDAGGDARRLDALLATDAHLAPRLPAGSVVFLHAGLQWADSVLRCEIPARWLRQQGVPASIHRVVRALDVLLLAEANPEATLVVRRLVIDPALAERLNRRPFLLDGGLPVQLMLDRGRRREWVGPKVEPGQRALLKAARRVIAFSEPLALALRGAGAREVVVIPDALDTLPPAPVTDPDRLAWVGVGERWDGALILPALAALLADRPRLRVAVAHGANGTALADHPQIDRLLGAERFLPYHAYLARLVACAPAVILWPLAAHEGTKVRGMSTALNAAVAGAALLVSPRGLYRTHFRDGEECLFVEDDGWEAAITRVLDEPGLREHLAAGLRRWVGEHALIEHTGPLWAQALGIDLPRAAPVGSEPPEA